jgi:hypothetical protein
MKLIMLRLVKCISRVESGEEVDMMERRDDELVNRAVLGPNEEGTTMYG